MISDIGWQSLEERGAIARLTLMYKIVHSVVDISTSPLLPRGRQSRHHTSSETIVSNIDSISYPTARYLANIVSPIVANTPRHEKNSADVASKRRDLTVTPRARN